MLCNALPLKGVHAMLGRPEDFPGGNCLMGTPSKRVKLEFDFAAAQLLGLTSGKSIQEQKRWCKISQLGF